MKKSKAKAAVSREKARTLLAALISGDGDPYEAYTGLYQLWCSHNSAVQQLRPLFRIPGADPAGRMSLTEEFRREVVAISHTLILHFQKPTG
jgi:hypothetical protein